ncbi:hypothetical protein MSTE_02914 [Mycobacteroides stephanolepidis]|uniref:Uncharacterized protein n=1 Tax=[Mycobacterium] stephanolepidis TaxID=1520670 RepID=A0A1Z4EZ38_9MYCO|nr:hypothetical protein MSTE_02914 [[Mycobacterium] stephanolepidis]
MSPRSPGILSKRQRAASRRGGDAILPLAYARLRELSHVQGSDPCSCRIRGWRALAIGGSPQWHWRQAPIGSERTDLVVPSFVLRPYVRTASAGLCDVVSCASGTDYGHRMRCFRPKQQFGRCWSLLLVRIRCRMVMCDQTCCRQIELDFGSLGGSMSGYHPRRTRALSEPSGALPEVGKGTAAMRDHSVSLRRCRLTRLGLQSRSLGRLEAQTQARR